MQRAGLLPGSFSPVAVLEAGGQPLDEDMPDVAGAVQFRVEGELHQRLGVAGGKEHQSQPGGVAGEDREVDPAMQAGCAERQRVAAQDGKIVADGAQQAVTVDWGHGWWAGRSRSKTVFTGLKVLAGSSTKRVCQPAMPPFHRPGRSRMRTCWPFCTLPVTMAAP